MSPSSCGQLCLKYRGERQDSPVSRSCGQDFCRDPGGGHSQTCREIRNRTWHFGTELDRVCQIFTLCMCRRYTAVLPSLLCVRVVVIQQGFHLYFVYVWLTYISASICTLCMCGCHTALQPSVLCVCVFFIQQCFHLYFVYVWLSYSSASICTLCVFVLQQCYHLYFVCICHTAVLPSVLCVLVVVINECFQHPDFLTLCMCGCHTAGLPAS